MLHLFDFSFCQKCVGHVDAYDQGRTGSPILDKELLGKCADLGRAVAGSIGKPYDEVDTWVGDDGECPLCHNSLVTLHGNTDVECPVCGIWGTLKIEDGKVFVEWPKEQIARARNTLIGIYEHHDEIQNMIKVCVPKLVENKEYITAELEKYKNF